MLPHHQWIFPELPLILLVTVRRFHEQPPTVAIPKSLRGIVRIFLSIAARMMPNVIRAPSQCGIFERPSTRHQEAGFDPRFALKAPMRHQTMVAYGNTETGHKIQHDKHDPIERGKAVEIPKPRNADDGGHRHQGKNNDCWVVRLDVWCLHRSPPVTL